MGGEFSKVAVNLTRSSKLSLIGLVGVVYAPVFTNDNRVSVKSGRTAPQLTAPRRSALSSRNLSFNLGDLNVIEV
jgi:hypothetical protein